MMKRPLLVFDLDGTLADTAPDLMGTLNVILKREGLAPIPIEAARSLLGAGARVLITRGFERAGKELAPEKLNALFADFLSYYEAHIADGSRLFPGVERALDRFAAAGFTLAVCTNKMERGSKLLLAELGIADRFAAICGQDTFAIPKPDPRIFRETVALAGGGPAIMIGDSRTDIDTARNAGAPVIAVDFGYTDAPIETFKPDLVISHFDELWDAVEALTPRATG
jgi:phosphoglycolate phosphatase